MNRDNVIERRQSLIFLPVETHNIEIPSAAPVKLHTFDMARHVAIAPDSKRYVVATADDTRIQKGYVTSVYPQQGGYMTLLRLAVAELSSKTPEEAIQRHIATVQAIQNGKLSELAH